METQNSEPRILNPQNNGADQMCSAICHCNLLTINFELKAGLSGNWISFVSSTQSVAII